MTRRKNPCKTHDYNPDDIMGAQIRNARKELGWSRATLIKEAKLSYSPYRISDIESGRYIPPAEVIAKMGKSLGLDLRSLYAAAKTVLYFRYMHTIEGQYCRVYEKYEGHRIFN